MYDPCPNGWGHKLPKDTTNIVRLVTKNFNSISLPPNNTPNAKLHNTSIDLHAIDTTILAGQEPCIDFKKKGKTQEIKYAYMNKYKKLKNNNYMQRDPCGK